uniref:Uncharacterized protein n=1 Tax=Tetranychus urticae TaxID=32264 RepID=T1KZS5_TETUR
MEAYFFVKLICRGAFGEIVASIRRNQDSEIPIHLASTYFLCTWLWTFSGEFLFKTLVKTQNSQNHNHTIRQFSTLFSQIAVFSFATYVLIDKNQILNANKTFVSILLNILNGPLAMLLIVIAFGANPSSFLPNKSYYLLYFLIAIRRPNNYLEGEHSMLLLYYINLI